MSLVDGVQAGLRTLVAGIDRAGQEAASADHGARQAAAHAVAVGFVGVAQNVAGVREVIGQIRAGIGGLAAHTSEAAAALANVPQQPTPQEVIATLAPVAEKLSRVHDGVGGCIGLVDQARQMTATVLRGGDPGALLARLDAVQQVLAAVGQHGTTTRQQVEAAIAEARKTGGSGN
ncbi:DUF6244 family protein [Polymorphospora lycopeni]|uniref:DUF6244 family protein n=1 Tax=Polymorphospora lycopeni TaxID=3140240 RepID=A0ABV5CNP4_9ACTN